MTALTTTGPGISPVTRPALTSPKLAGGADTSLSAAAGTLAPDSVEDTIFEDLRAGGTSSTVQSCSKCQCPRGSHTYELLLCHTVCPDKFDASMLVTPGSAAAAAGGAAAGGAAAGVKVTNGVVSNAPAHSAATNRLAYEMLAQHRIDVDEVRVALVRHLLAKQCE